MRPDEHRLCHKAVDRNQQDQCISMASWQPVYSPQRVHNDNQGARDGICYSFFEMLAPEALSKDLPMFQDSEDPETGWQYWYW